MKQSGRMISSDEAYTIVMQSVYAPDIEQTGINDALGRVLAEDIHSDTDMPPFDKSAMDGYACRKEDLENELEVIELIPAGKVPEKRVWKNQCAKIMTGAMLPDGADCVIMIEHTVETGKNSIRIIEVSTNLHICYKGEDVKNRDRVLQKGTLLYPRHIAILASVGAVNPIVYKRPHVGIISTGDELVEPEIKPSLSQIRNSNGSQLTAQVKQAGGLPRYYGIAGDTEEETFEIITQAMKECDLLLISGGVSMGDFDFVPVVVQKTGFDILFKSIAVQPGRPTLFGAMSGKFCFGLPGNPVSSFVQFELLVKPLIYKMMGAKYTPLSIRLPMAIDYQRKKTKRQLWIPVYITEEGTVTPAEYHGSAHLSAYTDAHGMIPVPVGKSLIKKGEPVHVRSF
ncbi:MAG: molybdopterin molybdotransferase MoeA [Bacteroidetes bacterium]|nr:molybdopterin molybdotransferase MoeA [Bacteroidota bacterium]